MLAASALPELAVSGEFTGGLQQQSSTVGAALSLIKLGNDSLAKHSWEQQTLCCAIVRH
jgi:hypothetical protein